MPAESFLAEYKFELKLPRRNKEKKKKKKIKIIAKYFNTPSNIPRIESLDFPRS